MSKAEEILERQKAILERIRSGRDCTKDALMQAFGRNDRPLSLRSLNSDIEALRKQGFPIASKKGCFFLSSDAAPEKADAEAPGAAEKETVFEHAGRKTLRDLYILHLLGDRNGTADEADVVADYTRRKDSDSFRISATNLGAEMHETRKAYLAYGERPEVTDSLDRLLEASFLTRDENHYSLTPLAPRRLNLTEEETLRILQRIHSLGGAYSFSDELKSIADRLSLAFFREADEQGREFRTVGFRRIRMPQLESDLDKLRGIPYSSRTLRITYGTEDHSREFLFRTGLFFYAADKRRLYLIGRETDMDRDTTLICSRIRSIQVTEEENPLFRNAYYMRMYDEMFSVSTDPAEHVAVEFERVFNVEEKLERLLLSRRYGKVTRREDTILYEDTIRGMADFFKYLRGFGRSVRILAPASLQDLARRSAERLLERYEEVHP